MQKLDRSRNLLFRNLDARSHGPHQSTYQANKLIIRSNVRNSVAALTKVERVLNEGRLHFLFGENGGALERKESKSIEGPNS